MSENQVAAVRRGSVLSNLDHGSSSHPAHAAGSADEHDSISSRRSPSDDSHSVDTAPPERRGSDIKNEDASSTDGGPSKPLSSLAHSSSVKASPAAKQKDPGEPPETKKRKRSQRACGVFPCGRCLKLKLACKEPADPNASMTPSSSMMVAGGGQAAEFGSAPRSSQPSSRHVLPSPSSQRRQRHHLYHSNPGVAASATPSAPGAVGAGGPGSHPMVSGAHASASGVPGSSAHGRSGGGGGGAGHAYHQHHANLEGGPHAHSYSHGGHHAGGGGPALSWDDVSPVDFLRRLERLESTLDRVSQRVDRESSLSWHHLSPSDVLMRFERLESSLDRIVHRLDRDRSPMWHDDRSKERYGGPMEHPHPPQQQHRYHLPPPQAQAAFAGSAAPAAGPGSVGPSHAASSSSRSAAPAGARPNGGSAMHSTAVGPVAHAKEPRHSNRAMTPEDSEIEVDELAQDGQSELGQASVEHTPLNGRYSGHVPGHHADRKSDTRSSDAPHEAAQRPGAGNGSAGARRSGGGEDTRDAYDPIRGSSDKASAAAAAPATRPSPMMERRDYHPQARLPRLESGGMDRWYHDQRHAQPPPGSGYGAPYADRGRPPSRESRGGQWQQAGYAD
ncbi:uncharacterized protein PSFLO_07129 [Pseudozyma flocculosa]|uniref:Uncharacterized protein n=1 Tax=Pseudozyma flocculosa TaxID=84751 RepID=A0A5C3FDE0_9BASI|nr:uncharacterized protein PSFLO_07129 [Pseudozyma flocculosa]